MFWILSFIVQCASIIWEIVNKEEGQMYHWFLYTVKTLNIVGLLILIVLMFKTVHRSENAPR